MPTFYPQLNENLTNWILEQRVFWTGTAPLVGKHVGPLQPQLPYRRRS